MKTIKDSETFNDIVKGNMPVLVDFYADWCGPCIALGPILDQISKEYEGKVETLKVNVDENKELASAYKIRSIPTLFFIKDSELKDVVTGAPPEAELRKKLDSLVDAA